MTSHSCRLVVFVLLCFFLSPSFLGCEAIQTQQRQRQLERVAKDWCMTIRASQVIPVYPLTEDLQPGDVFLVQTPVQKQEQLYRERGFLLLDQMVTRLDDLDYATFYKNAYFQGDYADGLPHSRPTPEDDDDENARRFKEAKLPMAAFPTYSFTVDTSRGLNIAIPVKGVPIGLGILGADRAVGTITISDGMTYAIDSKEALRKLHRWTEDISVRRTLQNIQRTTKDDVFLRVVTRVYFTGAVDVNLMAHGAGGFGADVGNATGLTLPTFDTDDPEVARNRAAVHQAVLEELSKPLGGAIPGGSFRITWASERTVALKERFPRLLAIGYLGFDVQVLPDGSLGAPIATRDVIDPQIQVRPILTTDRGWTRIAYLAMYEAFETIKSEGRHSQAAMFYADAMNELAELVPPTWFVNVYGSARVREEGGEAIVRLGVASKVGNKAPTSVGYRRVHIYWGSLDGSMTALKQALQSGASSFEIEKPDGAVEPISRERLQQDLKVTEGLLRGLEDRLSEDHRIADALEFWQQRLRR